MLSIEKNVIPLKIKKQVKCGLSTSVPTQMADAVLMVKDLPYHRLLVYVVKYVWSVYEDRNGSKNND